MKTTFTDLSGTGLISIGAMAKKSGVSASAIRGYEKMGLLRDHNIRVVRAYNTRFFYPEDAFKLSQIKARRLSNRNQILAAQGGAYANH